MNYPFSAISTDRYIAYYNYNYILYQCTKWYYLSDLTTLCCFRPHTSNKLRLYGVTSGDFFVV